LSLVNRGDIQVVEFLTDW